MHSVGMHKTQLFSFQAEDNRKCIIWYSCYTFQWMSTQDEVPKKCSGYRCNCMCKNWTQDRLSAKPIAHETEFFL